MILPASKPTSELFEKIQAFRPTFLMTMPSVAAALAIEANARPGANLRIETMQLYGEVIKKELAGELSETFGASIHGLYATQEVGIIGQECPIENCYHCNDEGLIVEILRVDGRLCDVGEFGEVTVTDLTNFATPIVRYRTGDVAKRGGICACGRGLSTLLELRGRTRNLVLRADGATYWPRVGPISRALRSEYGITQSKIVQISLNEVELHINGPDFPNADQVGAIADLIRFWLDAPFVVSIVVADPGGWVGKFEDYKREFR